jgi:hypothetical protein
MGFSNKMGQIIDKYKNLEEFPKDNAEPNE